LLREQQLNLRAMELGKGQLHFGAKHCLDVQLKIKSLLSELSWLKGPRHWHDVVLQAIAWVSAVFRLARGLAFIASSFSADFFCRFSDCHAAALSFWHDRQHPPWPPAVLPLGQKLE
jgi:hypothetical protein